MRKGSSEKRRRKDLCYQRETIVEKNKTTRTKNDKTMEPAALAFPLHFPPTNTYPSLHIKHWVLLLVHLKQLEAAGVVEPSGQHSPVVHCLH